MDHGQGSPLTQPRTRFSITPVITKDHHACTQTDPNRQLGGGNFSKGVARADAARKRRRILCNRNPRRPAHHAPQPRVRGTDAHEPRNHERAPRSASRVGQVIAWRWIDRAVLIAVHEMQLAEHGGGAGLRDVTLLESALAKPLNLVAYGEPDICALAAAYGYGIARNHAFIDGNKRTAFVAIELFLRLNGWQLSASDADCVLTLLAVASGEITEPDFAVWLRAHAAAR
ncbi:MAG: type II toxin-antitoxin system death-on-curing family toxin [Burkholderiales bacterium]|nr:type II toxin-antitoxin system death-on-curing family toxin [Burkholderiales bacterium]